MIYLFFLGILLGLGAAVPLGPVNFEMLRRNLKFGFSHGVFFGLGACFADLVYIVISGLGAISFINHPLILKYIGILGSLVLGFFGIRTLLSKEKDQKNTSIHSHSLYKDFIEGHLITLINPYTILFWISVSSQIATISSRDKTLGIIITGLGVIAGTVGWDIGSNLVVYYTKHKFSNKTLKILNISSGWVLIGFSLFGLYRSIFRL